MGEDARGTSMKSGTSPDKTERREEGKEKKELLRKRKTTFVSFLFLLSLIFLHNKPQENLNKGLVKYQQDSKSN